MPPTPPGPPAAKTKSKSRYATLRAKNWIGVRKQTKNLATRRVRGQTKMKLLPTIPEKKERGSEERAEFVPDYVQDLVAKNANPVNITDVVLMDPKLTNQQKEKVVRHVIKQYTPARLAKHVPPRVSPPRHLRAKSSFLDKLRYVVFGN